MLNRKKTVPQPSDFPEVMNQVQVALFLGISQTKVSRICDEIRSAAEKTALSGYF